LFESSISWAKLGKYPKSACKYTIEKAVVTKETALLTIEIRLNFVIPPADLEKIRGRVLVTVPGLADVQFVFLYEDMLQAQDAPDPSAPDPPDPAPLRLIPPKAKTERKSLYGRVIAPAARVTPMSALTEESGNVVVEGVIFGVSVREVFGSFGGRAKAEKYAAYGNNEKKQLVSLMLTDYDDSACVKLFIDAKTWKKLESNLTPGSRIRAAGVVGLDHYDHDLTILGRGIEALPLVKRTDTQPLKRVELHAHTKMSALDGLADVARLVELAAEFGHEAVAVTDHGVVQAFPEAAKAGKKAGIKIIFGLEGYLFDNGSFDAPADGAAGAADGITGCPDRTQYKSGQTCHVILLAKNEIGLKNLYKLVSFSHLHYFYKKPRIPKSLLAEYREGLIIGSACEAGQVYQAARSGVPDGELEAIASFYDYLEIQPLVNNRFLVDNGTVRDTEELKRINERIVGLGRKLGKPVAATCDSHYLEKHEAKYRKILMAGQGYKDLEGDKGLYFRTTDEMLEEFAYLGEEEARRAVIDAPRAIAAQIKELSPVPQGKFPPKIENSDKILRQACMETAWGIYGDPLPAVIQGRLDRELNSIIGNNYAVMYVSAMMLVRKSMQDGYLVGSRGSVGSSFAATMAGITEVNPLPPHYICPESACKHLTWGDVSLYDCGPDMPEKACPLCGARLRQDGYNIPFETFLGFEGDKEPDIDLNFAGEYQPAAHKYVEELFGSENVFRAGTIGTIKGKTAYGFIKKYHEDRGIPVNKWETERLIAACIDVRRTTGQHPGGIIIVPEGHEIYEFCPTQYPANDSESGIVTTHFDYSSIHENLLKLDILGHDVPSMIWRLQDLTGVDPLSVSLNDPKVSSIFNGVEGLDIKVKNYPFSHGSYGIPEFGTRFVRQMLDVTRPQTFADLIRISGFSHGTDVWVNNAHDFIKNGQASLKEVISTRDDIMNYLIAKGLPDKLSFKIMESVRKGNGISEEEAEQMRRHNVPDWYADSCRRIKYMFPKAHAVAYVMMSYRIAYYKVYHPAAFYAVYFTASVADFNAEAALKGTEGIRERLNVLESKGKNATQKEQDEATVLEVLYEMFARGYGLLPPDLFCSDVSRFVVENGKLRIPLAALPGVGENAARGIKEAYEKSPFISVDDLRVRSRANKTAVEALLSFGALGDLPASNQISMF
jgi:DNA polymerase-3 subunit alpha (Gram-positive type)